MLKISKTSGFFGISAWTIKNVWTEDFLKHDRKSYFFAFLHRVEKGTRGITMQIVFLCVTTDFEARLFFRVKMKLWLEKTLPDDSDILYKIFWTVQAFFRLSAIG